MARASTSPIARTDVVIAGGGIGGAVLAALLSRAGKEVIVLEREGHPSLAPNRAEILWPRTVERLFSLAPRSEWEESAMLPLEGVRFDVDGKWHPLFDDDVIDLAGAQPWCSQPMRVREKLLSLGGFEVRRDVTVTGLTKEDDHAAGVRFVTADDATPRWIAADWMVGDDGVHSSVRRDAGISLCTQDFPIEFMGAPVRWPSELQPGIVHGWLDWADDSPGLAAVVLFPFPRGESLVLFLARQGAVPDWDAIRRRSDVMRKTLPDNGLLDRLPRIRRPYGHNAEYGVANVCLLGDAIHPVSPAGGQGANMAVADAVALAECILEEPAAAVIAAYQSKRHESNERSVSITRRAVTMLSLPDWLPQRAMLKGALTLASHAPRVRAEVLNYIANAFV